MRMFIPSSRLLLCAILFFAAFFPSIAQADQIVLMVDDQGRRIFVNAGSTSTPVDWITRGLGSSLVPADIDGLLEKAASRHQVDPDLVRAIVKVESDYDPKAVSRKGAMGLMQLVPDTARRLGVSNPFDPQQNLEGGVTHLRYLLDRFRGNVGLSLAAYNAGENAVERYRGIPAFPETREYVRKIRRLYGNGEAEARTLLKAPPAASITRYVDQYGVVHFTNLE
jgi:soluble lytic murein transglycosylase-like protein